ncbi:hypothetical protein [Halococcus saccharolyticus]|uniref:Uncharacterized protein n=1 Tax=Halococcus saccharolyticus DSM 5350 TaxID=1227455 RepID=M0MLX3_9EURY|nr:hypothetical protein [Halococcus saccharolyticus]EMA46687.1 hypothetical protein C449_03436 [Halococcus saccharolyticus DSM 5350]
MLAECDLDESRREQVERYLAGIRYGIFSDREANDADDLAFHSVEWTDIAEWDVPPGAALILPNIRTAVSLRVR